MLGDPSHLTTDQVQELLDHWYARQEKGSRVLRFHQVLKNGELQVSTVPSSRGQAKRSGNGKKGRVTEQSDDDSWTDASVQGRPKHSGKRKKKIRVHEQSDDNGQTDPGGRGQAKLPGKGKKKQRFEDHSDEDMPAEEAKGSRRGKKKVSCRDESDDTADPLEDTHLPVFSNRVYKTPLPVNRPRPGRSSRDFLAASRQVSPAIALQGSSKLPDDPAPDPTTQPEQTPLPGHVGLPDATWRLDLHPPTATSNHSAVRQLTEDSPEPAVTPKFTQELQAIANAHAVQYQKKVFVQLREPLC